MTLLQVLWFFLIFLLIAGYFVLDGFDLGAGILSPFIAKNDEERAQIRRSIGPVWDGNEVWLLTAGGALFAAFPPAYATTFSGFYLAIMLVLFGLIVRAVCFEFRAHDPKMGRVWDACFFIGSLLPALLFGVALGNVFQGIPMDANGDYSGLALIGLITPFTLVCGVLGLAFIISAGAAWIALKAPEGSALQQRTARLRVPLQVLVVVLFTAVSALALLVVQPTFDAALLPLRVVCGVLVLAGMALAIFFATKGADLHTFLSQSIAMVASVFLFAGCMFPNLVVATADSVGPAITLMNSSSSELTLFCMTVIAAIGVPLVLAYHVIVYRIFSGRVEADENY